MDELDFFQPGNTPLPFDYIDRYMPLLTAIEWRVFLTAARLSWGEGQYQAFMPLSKITVLAGASQVSCIKALKALKEYNLIVETERSREGTCYAPQLDLSQIDIDGLEERRAEKNQRDKGRTKKGREEARKTLNGVKIRIIPNSEIAREGYVYLASSDIGLYKIGISRNPRKRVAKLRAQSPLNILLQHFFSVDDMARAEAQLHKVCEPKHYKGEWFSLSQEDVAWIQSITEYKDGRFIVR